MIFQVTLDYLNQKNMMGITIVEVNTLKLRKIDLQVARRYSIVFHHHLVYTIVNFGNIMLRYLKLEKVKNVQLKTENLNELYGLEKKKLR